MSDSSQVSAQRRARLANRKTLFFQIQNVPEEQVPLIALCTLDLLFHYLSILTVMGRCTSMHCGLLTLHTFLSQKYKLNYILGMLHPRNQPDHPSLQNSPLGPQVDLA